jgi:hypothetical protein
MLYLLVYSWIGLKYWCGSIKCKGKGHPRTGHEGPEVELRYNYTLSLTLALDGECVVNPGSRPLYPRERPGTHCIGGWMGPRAGLEGCGKSRPPPGFDPRTMQPVASGCTDWAIPVWLCYSPIIERNLSRYQISRPHDLQIDIWYIYIYIFNRSWVDTRWQQYITNLHTNCTHNTEKGKL